MPLVASERYRIMFSIGSIKIVQCPRMLKFDFKNDYRLLIARIDVAHLRMPLPKTFSIPPCNFWELKTAVDVASRAVFRILQNSAVLFAREGAKVLCADLNGAAAKATADYINTQAGKIVAVSAEINVANPEQVEGMVHNAEKTFGKMDILFNNAGLMHMSDDDAIATEVWEGPL